jgi:phage terminase large subunit
MMDNEIYLDELMGELGLTNQDIVSRLKEMEISRNELIIGDSAEPKSIEEIRRGGFYIKGAEKGQDSVRIGIDLLKGYKMHITKRSNNLESNLRKYKWAEDKTGKSLNVPVDANNDFIDATRYIARAVLSIPTKRVFARKPIGF